MRKSVLLGMLFLASSASAQLLVVRSVGPSAGKYTTGSVIPATATLALKAGDEVVVMDGAGTRSLKGPGNIAASGPSQASSLASSLSNLTRQTNRGAARIGAVRGSVAGVIPSLYAVDVDGDGNYCTTAASPVTLWRADASAARTVTLKAGDKSATVSFAAGQASVPWPAKLAPTAATQVTATTDAIDHSLTIKPLSPEPKDFPALTAAFASNGCARQIAFLKKAAEGSAGGQ